MIGGRAPPLSTIVRVIIIIAKRDPCLPCAVLMDGSYFDRYKKNARDDWMEGRVLILAVPRVTI